MSDPKNDDLLYRTESQDHTSRHTLLYVSSGPSGPYPQLSIILIAAT